MRKCHMQTTACTARGSLQGARVPSDAPAGAPPPERDERQQHAHECDDANSDARARAHAQPALAVVLHTPSRPFSELLAC